MTKKLEQVILHFLNKGYGDLTEYRTDKYPNSIFYIKDKKIYMEQDVENKKLWVDYNTIWTDLENWFSLKHNDILSVITKWVEETYNLRGITPCTSWLIWPSTVEETYNLRGITPQSFDAVVVLRWKRLTI